MSKKQWTDETEKLLVVITNTKNKQADVADAYQAAFGKIPDNDWRIINTAIMNRWPSISGLVRVKTMAHKIYEEKGLL